MIVADEMLMLKIQQKKSKSDTLALPLGDPKKILGYPSPTSKDANFFAKAKVLYPCSIKCICTLALP